MCWLSVGVGVVLGRTTRTVRVVVVLAGTFMRPMSTFLLDRTLSRLVPGALTMAWRATERREPQAALRLLACMPLAGVAAQRLLAVETPQRVVLVAAGHRPTASNPAHPVFPVRATTAAGSLLVLLPVQVVVVLARQPHNRPATWARLVVPGRLTPSQAQASREPVAVVVLALQAARMALAVLAVAVLPVLMGPPERRTRVAVAALRRTTERPVQAAPAS